MPDDALLDRAAKAIDQAEALLIGAGAGMGVDSGLPDFRGPEGFWRAYPPYAKLGLRFEQMANPVHFRTNPALGWGFYGHRTNLYRKIIPHHGFMLLKKWASRMHAGSFVLTSNVDHQFQRADFDPNRIVECHGSIEHWQCLDGCDSGIFPADPAEIPVDPETFLASEPFPSCPGCRKLARPNILMFGDSGWNHRRTADQESRLSAWLEQIEGHRLVVVELGAGQAVPTVRLFCEDLVTSSGATLIRINVRDPEVPRGQIGLAMGALEALRAIDERLERSRGQ